VANDDRDQRSGAAEQAAEGAEPTTPGQRPASQQAADEASGHGQERTYAAPVRPAEGPKPGGPANPHAAGQANLYGSGDDRPPSPYGPIRYDPVGRYGAANELAADDSYGTYGAVGPPAKNAGPPAQASAGSSAPTGSSGASGPPGGTGSSGAAAGPGSPSAAGQPGQPDRPGAPTPVDSSGAGSPHAPGAGGSSAAGWSGPSGWPGSTGWPGAAAPTGQATAAGPSGAGGATAGGPSGAAAPPSPPGAPDRPGQPGPATPPGVREDQAADRHGRAGPEPANSHPPADRHRPLEGYEPGPQAYGRADIYGTADRFGSPEDYDPAGPYGSADDLYGPADSYRPEAYGRADVYRARDDYAAPGYGAPGYGPPGYGAPGYGGPDQAPPDPYRPAAGYGPAGPPAPSTSAPPKAPGTPAPPRDSAPPRAPGAHAAAPAEAGQQVQPPATRPGAVGGTAETEAAGAEGSADSVGGLTPEFLLPGRRRAPAHGWRRVVYQATGGLMRVPSSAAELRRRDMINRVRTPVAGGHHRVAVLSLKGGVGKTTTTVGLGSTLASLRGDRVIAVDANPDRGTLSDKVRLETAATVRDLLNEHGHIRRYADVRAFTSQAPSRLEVLASDRDPTVSVAFSEQDYGMVARVLEHYYSICITDCGTGLLHSAMAGVLRLADQIVLVSSPSVDGARSASGTLDWLAAHSYGDLVRNAVVVLSTVRPRSKSSVDLNRLEEHFTARCRTVVKIPYDSHLEEGAEVELDLLARPTADAYLLLAAVIGDGLAMPARARRVQ
jgi:MinD-like ATPase involved in chromosome partitioning or flagellar assembly